MITLAVCLGLLAVFFLWQHFSLRHFNVTNYFLSTDKIAGAVGLCVLSDLHNHSYGEQNSELIQAVRACAPDLILVVGDNIVVGETAKFPVSEQLMRALCGIAPVYFANGNHEMKSEDPEEPTRDAYMALKSAWENAGVHFLNNCHERVSLGVGQVDLWGLDLPRDYFRRFARIRMPVDTVYAYLGGEPHADCYSILLAHNPEYGETYAAAGFDLTLCGHNHGGLICLPKLGSIISPSFKLFPRFAFGDTEVLGNHVITSRGLGTHRYNFRVNNRAELLHITINGRQTHR